MEGNGEGVAVIGMTIVKKNESILLHNTPQTQKPPICITHDSAITGRQCMSACTVKWIDGQSLNAYISSQAGARPTNADYLSQTTQNYYYTIIYLLAVWLPLSGYLVFSSSFSTTVTVTAAFHDDGTLLHLLFAALPPKACELNECSLTIKLWWDENPLFLLHRELSSSLAYHRRRRCLMPIALTSVYLSVCPPLSPPVIRLSVIVFYEPVRQTQFLCPGQAIVSVLSVIIMFRCGAVHRTPLTILMPVTDADGRAEWRR